MNNNIKNLETVRKFLRKVIYTGIKESDCLFTDYNSSITLFGSGLGSNTAFNKQINYRLSHNNIKKNGRKQSKFFIKNIKHSLKKDSSLNFCSYNKHLFYTNPKNIQKYGVFEVEKSLYDFYNDKFESKIWAKKLVPCLEYKFIFGKDIKYEYLIQLFNVKFGTQFVIQEKESLSGIGTFIFNYDNSTEIINNIKKNKKFVVSVYLEDNIPVNLHFLIANDNFLILPGSVQIISTINNSLSYKGADFCAFDSILNKNIKNKLLKYTKIILSDMQENGYRGVGGVDFICSKDEVYFMEVNARFQSSTVVLNYALHENGLPTVNELDAMCFLCDKLINLKKFDVPYSKVSVNQGEEDVYTENVLTIFEDGYSKDEKLENSVYLYTKILKGSIYKK